MPSDEVTYAYLDDLRIAGNCDRHRRGGGSGDRSYGQTDETEDQQSADAQPAVGVCGMKVSEFGPLY